MRISTLNFLQGPVETLARLQSDVQRTQTEVATGTRLRSPADDPVAAGRVQELERWLLSAEQQARNSELLAGRLGLQETALADATEILQRVRELALQAGNGAFDEGTRRMLATEVRSRAELLLQVANRRSPSGDHVFAGGKSATQPFARLQGGIVYAGDDTLRDIEVAPGQRITDGLSGADLFIRVPAGNGSFAMRAAPGNAGTGVLGEGSVVVPSEWVADTYTVEFGPGGAWEARDTDGALVASGVRTGGEAIGFRGIRLALDGDPAAGDRFFVESGGTEDMFRTLDRLADALEAPVGDGARRAAVANEVNAVLRQLEPSLERLINVRSVLGARLNAIDYATAAREALREDVTTNLSQLRDTDMAEALTRLNMQMTGLQAAQQSYARLSRLSLFDYL